MHDAIRTDCLFAMFLVRLIVQCILTLTCCVWRAIAYQQLVNVHLSNAMLVLL